MTSRLDRKEKTTNGRLEQQKRVTNAEVVNGVHPLHWATSPSPSPMGTDPINVFKMVQNVSGISEHQLQQL